jgi:hypothetical protein
MLTVGAYGITIDLGFDYVRSGLFSSGDSSTDTLEDVTIIVSAETVAINYVKSQDLLSLLFSGGSLQSCKRIVGVYWTVSLARAII